MRKSWRLSVELKKIVCQRAGLYNFLMIITISESAFCFAAHIVYQTTQGYLEKKLTLIIAHPLFNLQETMSPSKLSCSIFINAWENNILGGNLSLCCLWNSLWNQSIYDDNLCVLLMRHCQYVPDSNKAMIKIELGLSLYFSWFSFKVQRTGVIF